MKISICSLVAAASLTLTQASYDSEPGFEYRNHDSEPGFEYRNQKEEVERTPGDEESKDDAERSIQEFKKIIEDGIQV